MGTGQILREVFEKRVKEQIELIDKLTNTTNPEIDAMLIRDSLNKITEHYYGKQKWVNAINNKPLAYKTGHWDGKNSDQVLAEDKNGNRYLAHYCEGFMDGSKFEDWYDCRDFLIETEIVKYLEIPE